MVSRPNLTWRSIFECHKESWVYTMEYLPHSCVNLHTQHQDLESMKRVNRFTQKITDLTHIGTCKTLVHTHIDAVGESVVVVGADSEKDGATICLLSKLVGVGGNNSTVPTYILSKNMSFQMSAALAGCSGFAGGLIGSPADLVNVRMQNDMKLPSEQRRNYKNVFHGLYKVISSEGVMRLWTGASTNCTRAMLMTIGQLSFYDQAKQILLATPYFKENVKTHVSSSLIAGAIATTMCQPIDVLKTRAMNAKPGEDRSFTGLLKGTLKEGPQALFKGYIPAFIRLAPHTILTFVFLEQLRLRFGTVNVERGEEVVEGEDEEVDASLRDDRDIP